MTIRDNSHSGFTRRETMRLLGMGAGLGVVSTLTGAERAAAAFQAAPGPKRMFAEGAYIRTVLRDVLPEFIGWGATLFHEHISQQYMTPGGRGVPPPGVSFVAHFSDDLDLMTEEIVAARKDGVSCIVDGGNSGPGRSVDFLKQLSYRSGVAIVASGGWLANAYPPRVAGMTEDELVEEFVRDAFIERWGAVGELGTLGAEISPIERKVFRAVAKTQVRVGLPIFTHTANGLAALDQLAIFESLGVDPHSVCIGHLGNLDDPAIKVHKEVARRGAFVGIDRAARTPELDEQMVRIVVAMIEAGYADNVLLSADIGADRNVLKRYGGPGYAKTLTVLGPKLRAAGVKQEVLHSMTVDNPRRFLAFILRKG